MIKTNISDIQNLSAKRQQNLLNEINYSGTKIDKALNSKKVTYENLNSLIPPIPNSVKKVTLYFDLYNLINRLYIKSNNPSDEEVLFLSKNKYLLASHLIGVVAHYRRYFATRRGLLSDYYFYYNTQIPKYENSIIPTFQTSYFNKRFSEQSEFHKLNQLISENIRIFKMIVEYIPNAYLIDSEDINKSLVPYHFINRFKEDKSNINIVVSSYKYEMLNSVFNEETYFLDIKQSENTKFLIPDLESTDLIDNFVDKNNKSLNISYYLLPYLFTLTGYDKYDVPSIGRYGQVKAIKLIENCLESSILSNEILYHPELFLQEISKVKLSESQFENLKKNIKIFYLPEIYNQVTANDKLKFDMCKVDYYDYEGLMETNKLYFERNPINIDDLFLTERYE